MSKINIFMQNNKNVLKINIQGINDIDDPFYRYTMTKLNVIRQRTKTVIDNLVAVSKDLDRDPKLIVDYFKKKFSVSFLFKNDILSTTTDISYDQFVMALRDFIEIYVLCGTCKLPETEILINKNKILLTCKCCPNMTSRIIK